LLGLEVLEVVGQGGKAQTVAQLRQPIVVVAVVAQGEMVRRLAEMEAPVS
jgi:hypothetical protein